MTDSELLRKHVGFAVAYFKLFVLFFIRLRRSCNGLAADQDKLNTIYFVGRIARCHNNTCRGLVFQRHPEERTKRPGGGPARATTLLLGKAVGRWFCAESLCTTWYSSDALQAAALRDRIHAQMQDGLMTFLPKRSTGTQQRQRHLSNCYRRLKILGPSSSSSSSFDPAASSRGCC